MPDVGPSDQLVRELRLRRQRKQVELNVMDCELRLAEIEQERRNLQENIKASKTALDEIDTEIAELGGEKEGDE